MKPKKKKTKKNSNYQIGFTSVVKHLPEYEYLRNQTAYTMLLDMEAQSEEVGRFIRHVFVQLQENTGTMFPNYFDFRASLNGHLSNNKHTEAMHYKTFSNGAVQEAPTTDHAMYLIAAVYYGAVKRLAQDIENEPDEQGKQALGAKYWAILNRWKLLQSLFENLERFFAALDIMTADLSLSDDNLLEFGDEIPSPQNLMVRLNYALNRDLKDASNRLVGMLQMVRDKLDPGEYAYFSAMVYMKESDKTSLDKAYKELKKIPETAVEYGASRGMLAEVLARKGNPGDFLEVFNYTAHINPFAMCCYVQQLILNTPFQSTTEGSVEQAGQSEAMQQLLIVFEKLADCEINNLEITGEEKEYFVYLNNVLEASKQIYHFIQELPYLAPNNLDQAILPGTVNRAHTLLTITAPLYNHALMQLLAENTKENRMQFVTKYFNFPQKGSVTAVSPRFDLMLRASRAFLLDDEFVDFFLQYYKTYEKFFDEKLLLQWLTEAYFTALSCEHPRQAELRGRLDKLCPNQDSDFEDDVTCRSVWGMLTGPGKLLYASAESSYRAARDSDYGWKDAGMLSMGFFRLVEEELRQRLLVNVFGKKDPDVSQWLREVEQRRKEESDGDRYAKVTVGKEAFDLSRTLIALKQPEKLTMEQMEFCFYLLSEQAETAPEWTAYRDALRQKFYRVLSAEGIQAAKDGRIAQAICQRQSYRNPPAHARYLSIEKAGECRDYVNQTIRTLCCTWLV